MKTTLARRKVVAKAAKTLREYRKEHRLCRECGDPLEDKDKTRCFRCKLIHSVRELVLYYKRKRKVDASK